MILIVESGATKTDWCLVAPGRRRGFPTTRCPRSITRLVPMLTVLGIRRTLSILREMIFLLVVRMTLAFDCFLSK